MILHASIQLAFVMMSLSLAFNLWRLQRGPDMPDRILALDTLTINTIALLLVVGIHFASPVYFESALLLAMSGFIATAACCKVLLRGDIIE